MFTLISTLSTTQVTCTGSADGTANVSMLGWNWPYTYLWDNGITSSNNFGLLAGTYNVLVVDANSCQITDSVVVTESDSTLAFTADITHLSCYQNNTGIVSVSVIGGLRDTLTYGLMVLQLKISMD